MSNQRHLYLFPISLAHQSTSQKKNYDNFSAIIYWHIVEDLDGHKKIPLFRAYYMSPATANHVPVFFIRFSKDRALRSHRLHWYDLYPGCVFNCTAQAELYNFSPE